MIERTNSERSELSNNEKQFGFGDIVQFKGGTYVITSINMGMAEIRDVMNHGNTKSGVKVSDLSKGGYSRGYEVVCGKVIEMSPATKNKLETKTESATRNNPQSIKEFVRILLGIAIIKDNVLDDLGPRLLQYKKNGEMYQVVEFDERGADVMCIKTGDVYSYTYSKIIELFEPFNGKRNDKEESFQD